MTSFDLDHVVAICLHAARDLLLAQAEKARGPRRRRLKNVESAILDAIGAVARNGLTIDECRDAADRAVARRIAPPPNRAV